ncbi:hypothetical protein JHV56_05185 [Arthrobacter sp. BHU FT2]|nr:hypothetical protein [Arthrobacter sp. BHU FT2]
MQILLIGGVALLALLLGFVAALYPAAVVGLLALVVAAFAVALARRRVRRRIVEYTADPRLSLELMLFPLAVSVRQSAVVTVGLVGLLTLAMLCRRRDPESGRANLLPFGMLAAAAVMVFRVDIGMPVVVAALAVLFLWAAAVKVPRPVALPSLATGVGVYLIANVLGHFARVPSPLDASRLGGYETSSGFFGQRLVFPFARSINEPAVMAAAYLAIVAAMWIIGRKVGPLRWLGVAAAGYVMFGSNSRLPFIVAALLIAATLLTPLLTRRLATPVVAVSGALPFYLPVALPIIAAVAESIANIDYLSRGQSVQDIIGLGTRGTIWEGSTQFWLNRVDVLHQLLGYGPNGHAASGANRTYLSGLGGFLADKTNLTMHNSFLQQLFDGGLVGLGLLAAALLIVLRRYAKDVSLLPQLLFVAVLGVGAASEIILAPGFTQTPFFLLLAFAAFAPAAAASKRREVRQPQTANSLS